MCPCVYEYENMQHCNSVISRQFKTRADTPQPSRPLGVFLGVWNSGHPGDPPGTPQELLKYRNSVISRLFGTRGSTPKADWPPGCVSGGLDVPGTPPITRDPPPGEPHTVTRSFLHRFGRGKARRNRAGSLTAFLGVRMFRGPPGDSPGTPTQ